MVEVHPANKLELKLKEYSAKATGLKLLNAEQAVNITRLIRRVIEKDGHAIEYPRAKLYGDWLQHNEITNPVALSALEQINRSVISGVPLDVAVPLTLGTGSLRYELTLLFARYNLDDTLIQTVSVFFRFMSLLIEEYIDCPIGFSNEVELKGKSLESFKRIERETYEAIGPGDGVVPIIDRLLIEKLDDSDGHLGWRIEFRLPDGARIATRGILPFLDSGEFRINDLGMRFVPWTDRQGASDGLKQLLDANLQFRQLFLTAGPRTKH